MNVPEGVRSKQPSVQTMVDSTLGCKLVKDKLVVCIDWGASDLPKRRKIYAYSDVWYPLKMVRALEHGEAGGLQLPPRVQSGRRIRLALNFESQKVHAHGEVLQDGNDRHEDYPVLETQLSEDVRKARRLDRRRRLVSGQMCVFGLSGFALSNV
jgi:hypothetical protein